MISLQDFQRLIRQVKNKLALLVGRAVLLAVNDSGQKTQRLKLALLADEVCTDVERFEEYGFSTYPLEGAEAVAAFLNGNRDHGIVLCVHDRRHRPQDMEEGEVRMYHNSGSYLRFRDDKKIELVGKDITVTAEGDATINVSGDATVTVGGDLSAEVSGDASLEASGDVSVDAGGAVDITAAANVNITGGDQVVVEGGPMVHLGGLGGNQVARVGDQVQISGVQAGVSTIIGQITAGSAKVLAS